MRGCGMTPVAKPSSALKKSCQARIYMVLGWTLKNKLFDLKGQSIRLQFISLGAAAIYKGSRS